MRGFLDILARSIGDGTFVALVLSKPAVPAAQGPRKITVRPVQIRGERRWQWTSHFPRGETHENRSAEQTVLQAAELLGSTLQTRGTSPFVRFAHAHLFTSNADYALRIDRRGAVHFRKSAPSKPSIEVIGEAPDGVEAIEKARRLQPDVIIMDVNMPRMNGIEATRRIKAEMPGVRVIAFSLHQQSDMAKAMRDAGADDYLR